MVDFIIGNLNQHVMFQFLKQITGIKRKYQGGNCHINIMHLLISTDSIIGEQLDWAYEYFNSMNVYLVAVTWSEVTIRIQSKATFHTRFQLHTHFTKMACSVKWFTGSSYVCSVC